MLALHQRGVALRELLVDPARGLGCGLLGRRPLGALAPAEIVERILIEH